MGPLDSWDPFCFLLHSAIVCLYEDAVLNSALSKMCASAFLFMEVMHQWLVLENCLSIII